MENEVNVEKNKIFKALYSEVSWLHFIWDDYEKLISKGQEQIDLLNDIGGSFFQNYQIVLIDHIIMYINRLLNDTCEYRDEKRLTLCSLLKEIDTVKEKEYYNKLYDKIFELKEKAKPFKKYRNKVIAHTDLKLAIGTSDQLTGISYSYKMINEILGGIRNIMKGFDLHFYKIQTLYNEPIKKNGAKDVVRFLERGKKYKELILRLEDDSDYIDIITMDKIISRIHSDDVFRAKVVACLEEGLK